MRLYKTIKLKHRNINIYTVKSQRYYDGSVFSYFRYQDLDGQIEEFKRDPIQNLSKNPITTSELKLWLKFEGMPLELTNKEQSQLLAIGYNQEQISR